MTEWSAQAACRTTDPDELFVQSAAQDRSKAVCTGCPVRTECLADALDNRVEFGVWGGMTERERRALLRRRPTVKSWRALLQSARTEYEQGTGLLVEERPRQPQEQQGLSPEQEQQYGALFRARFAATVGFLIAAGAGRHDAEDAVQSAFVHLARAWESVTHPEAWLRITAWRMWLKAKDKQNTWSSDPADLPEAGVPDPCGDIAEQVDLVQLLRRLPVLQRTVMAFEIDGATPAQTAEALEVPSANVRQNLRRARHNLERMLQEQDDQGGTL
ncbi:RNA polymerase sigma factor (sigma-70 family) [Streptomyces sp. SAI-208]|nr:RNA polymerase sigma factor (sigma-70 family) [Streptomyces sp. SAI-208]